MNLILLEKNADGLKEIVRVQNEVRTRKKKGAKPSLKPPIKNLHP